MLYSASSSTTAIICYQGHGHAHDLDNSGFLLTTAGTAPCWGRDNVTSMFAVPIQAIRADSDQLIWVGFTSGGMADADSIAARIVVFRGGVAGDRVSILVGCAIVIL